MITLIWSKIPFKKEKYEILLQFKISVFYLIDFKMSLIPDGKAVFSASLLQFSVSHILEIILICCSRYISYYYHRKLKNCCTVYIFVESFRIVRIILWMSKELNFNKYKSFETM